MISLWISRLSFFLATGFGAGFFPTAPGTIGTFVAYPLYWVSRQCLTPLQILIAAILAFFLGIPICQHASERLGLHDASQIVWDEIVAMVLILCIIPEKVVWQVSAFLLFRLFDIWKPFPIHWFDKHLEGGLGIMLDDLLAAIYTLVILSILIWMGQRISL